MIVIRLEAHYQGEIPLLTKTIIWLVVLMGILVACWIAFSTYLIDRRFNEIVSRSRYGSPRETSTQSVQIHDTYTVLGSGRWWQCRVYPRTWAAALIVAGAVLLIVGLVSILHVPHTHSA
jgi:hypothetical protein